jgi:hypothetical protein
MLAPTDVDELVNTMPPDEPAVMSCVYVPFAVLEVPDVPFRESVMLPDPAYPEMVNTVV